MEVGENLMKHQTTCGKSIVPKENPSETDKMESNYYCEYLFPSMTSGFFVAM